MGYAEAPAERLDVAMVELAVEQGHTLLAIDLLEALAGAADGWREAYYSAWILQLQGLDQNAREEFERLLEEAASDELEPAWLYRHLVQQVAASRLEQQVVEAATDLDDLLSRHYEARCGFARLQELDDLIAFGRMIVEETEIPLRLARKRPRFYRLDLFLPAGSQITATDGQVAWRISPSEGKLQGEYLSGPEAEPLLDGSWFDDVLVRFRESGENLFLAGSEELPSGDHGYRIEVDAPDGRRETVFLDDDTLLETQRMIWGDAPDQPAVKVTTEQAEFEGCYLPIRQVVEAERGIVEYVIESYRFGQPLTTAAFDRERVLEQLRAGDEVKSDE